MPPDPPSPETLSFMAAVHRAYLGLMRFADAPDEAQPDSQSEPHLGGKLVYGGELDETGRVYAAAANIAGAATLAASAKQSALRHASRDGTIDFLVNSLDEALRILKNEVRKRQRVAVAVSVAPEAIEAAMVERGVLPDLLPAPLTPRPESPAIATFLSQGAHRVAASTLAAGFEFLIWPIPAEFAQKVAAFDVLLAEHLSAQSCVADRWLRISPRYLGPWARRLRSLACDPETAAKLAARLGPPLRF